jgi:hypothetical protein
LSLALRLISKFNYQAENWTNSVSLGLVFYNSWNIAAGSFHYEGARLLLIATSWNMLIILNGGKRAGKI